MNESMKCDLGHAVVVEPPGHLRKVEVDAAEEGEDRGTDHDVVEVRDDEVRAPEDDVEDERREEDTRDPAYDEQE